MTEVTKIGLKVDGTVVPLEEADRVIVTEWDDDKVVKEEVYVKAEA